VSNAYSVLIDAEKRAHYDRFGAEEERPRPQYRQEYNQQDYEFEQFDDIFRAFFGGMPMQGHHRRGNVYT
jgi:DnaJ-class molecular chaperone